MYRPPDAYPPKVWYVADNRRLDVSWSLRHRKFETANRSTMWCTTKVTKNIATADSP